MASTYHPIEPRVYNDLGDLTERTVIRKVPEWYLLVWNGEGWTPYEYTNCRDAEQAYRDHRAVMPKCPARLVMLADHRAAGPDDVIGVKMYTTTD